MYKIQSVLFDKQFFTKEDAVDWCIEYGHLYDKIDSFLHYFRVRQIDAEILEMSGYSVFRTLVVKTGLKFVLAYN